jgi:CO/xanthine dehydrogenase FAD-binding subunit
MCAEFYLTPKSIDECLDNLTRFDGRGVLVAGGTDLIPQLKDRKIQPDALVDITEIRGLGRLEMRGNDTIIGGAATHSQVNADPQITEIWPALAAACGYVGSPQIRNIATLSGNIANAQPAADAAVALVAFGATE